MCASSSLEEPAVLLPSVAHRLKADGSTEGIPVEELQSGDRILIKPGEKIPAGGIIVDGKTNVNESMLTGESAPVNKQSGDEVIGGSINERSEEHTSELQSRGHLVCRLLLEKKK